MTTDPTIIANKFNTYFADIGLRVRIKKGKWVKLWTSVQMGVMLTEK